jgi:serine/threonine-protein kinase
MPEAELRTRYCGRCLATFQSDSGVCPNLQCGSRKPADGWGELIETGELIDRTYRVHRRLAVGGAGVTYLGREVADDGAEVGPLVAIKVLFAQRDSGAYLRRLANEAQILQGIDHPNVVQCRGFVHRAGHSPYLVTRFEPGGSLLDHVLRVGPLPPHVAARVGQQICAGLAMGHKQGVIHRDLKPENVLVEDEVAADAVPSVRVADFGIAKVAGGVGGTLTRQGAFVGTPQYAAPEQFDGLPPTPATDLYAVGAIVYFCLAGRTVAPWTDEPIEFERLRDHLVAHLPVTLGHLGGEDRSSWEATLSMAMAVMPSDRCDLPTLEERLAAHADRRDPGPRPSPGMPRLTPTQTISIDVLAGAATEKVPPGGRRSSDTIMPATEKMSRGPRAEDGATERVPARERRGGTGWGCALAAAGAGIGVLAAIGGGAWWWMNPSATTLSATDPDPRMQADWRGIAAKLGTAGVAAERACEAPPYLAIEVTVEADGRVSGARLLNYPSESVEACVARELQEVTMPREGTGRVKVAVTLRE